MHHVILKRVKFFDMKLSLLYDLPDITDLFVTRTQKKLVNFALIHEYANQPIVSV